MSRPRHLITQPHHLAARFVTSLSGRPPSVSDEVWAESWLRPAEVALWRRLCNQDRRHCITVARRFVSRRSGATRAEVAGALLHDVGKLDCDLGTWGRVVATMLGPRTQRMRSYHDHERVGAELASAAGSDPATVDLIAGRGPAFADLLECDRA